MFNIEKELKRLATKERARICTSFFKTRKGEYGEGDIFLGVTVPDTRKIVRKYIKELSLHDITRLLSSPYHEVRLFSLITFTLLMEKALKNNDKKFQKEIFDIYLKNTKQINNWDLVDVSAPKIVGLYLFDKNRNILYKLAKSKNLWERRIAIISTLFFIKKGDYKETFKLCEILMNDEHDLIHKACGWMLREAGKNCGLETLNMFLEKHAKHMSRTSLRYALEKHHPFVKAKFMMLR